MASSSRRVSPLRIARRASVSRGLLGGDRSWMVLGALLWLPRLARKFGGRSEQYVLTEKLEPGQTLVLRTISQKTKAERQALKQS